MLALPRRKALLGAAAVGAALSMRSGLAQPAASGPFILPPLPYAPDANEPHIDAQTMQIHHDRHHGGYVTGLNAAVKDYPQVAAMGLSAMLSKLGELPEAIRTAVRNNGGGHANHSMFWLVMGGKGGAPSGDLAVAIDRDFGSLDKLKEALNRAGLTQFGSGWTMVTVDRAGKLAVLNRPNQDTPLMDGARVLFGNDVWEHAYYLKYQNRRADYLAAWWNVVNWPEVAKRYDAARSGSLDI
jgi:superoxide dismutase, Fe-Mn family